MPQNLANTIADSKPAILGYYQGEKIDGYIYLRYTDITFGRVVTEYPDIFAERNKIYTSNGSQVYE